MKDKKAHNALIRARTVLLVSQPFFGCLALHLQLVEENDPKVVDTMAVDGVHMYYHPKFVHSLSEKELIGVVAHEVMHCVYRHMTRRGNRFPIKWNIAGDFVINADLAKAGFDLPGEPFTMKSPPGTKGYLLDPQFDGMSTEEVYEKLPDPKSIMLTIGGGKGDKNGEGTYKDFGGCGGVIDAAPKHDKAKANSIAADWEATVRMAVGVAKRANAGTVPAYLERLVHELQKPRISWRDQTRQFIDGNMTKDYSWSRPNRRYISSGLVLPGFVPDALHHLVFLGDVSGSIGPDIMKAYVSEIGGALDEGVADKITTAYFDTEIKSVDEFLPGDLVKCDAQGGGGTDFEPAFKWVMENAPDASCIVCLTDMMPCHWNIPDPMVPVLWAAYLPEKMLAGIKPPFGDVILVDGAD